MKMSTKVASSSCCSCAQEPGGRARKETLKISSFQDPIPGILSFRFSLLSSVTLFLPHSLSLALFQLQSCLLIGNTSLLSSSREIFGWLACYCEPMPYFLDCVPRLRSACGFFVGTLRGSLLLNAVMPVGVIRSFPVIFCLYYRRNDNQTRN